MARTLQAQETEAIARHQDSMMLSLAHRLEVARAANNLQLVQLLERERQVLAPTPHSSIFNTVLSELKQVWQDFQQSFTTGNELQVEQIEAGGDRWWYAYDPQTGASVYTDSDTELLRWINTNYHGN